MGLTILTNQEIYNRLSTFIIDEYFSNNDSLKNMEFGPMQINYFSVCFWLKSKINSEQKKGVYVKIPKLILFNKNNNIMPFSSEDKRLAEDEYNSLMHLSKYWPNDGSDVHFIKPLFFLKDYNAIFTKEICADHFFKLFRQSDLNDSTNNRSKTVKNILKRLGATLSKFHETSLKECQFNIESTILKITDSCLNLKSIGVSSKYIDQLIFKLQGIRDTGLKTHYANTLKGFDIRQVFIEKHEKVYLLDPGKLKFDYVEMDLARFITTCRLLYWGSILLFLQRSPKPEYEECFIQSYYGNKKPSSKILNLLIIKELLKHWRMAYTVTDLKSWPSPIKRLLKRYYIDPFYKGQVNSELIQLRF